MIDGQMIRAAQMGDQRAMLAVWRDTQRFAYTVARRYAPTASVGFDDLTQAAYLGVHSAITQHDGQHDFLQLVRWKVQSACREALGIRTSKRQIETGLSLDCLAPDGETPFAEMIEDESQPEVGAGLEAADLARDVRAAVAELPDRERQCIALRYFDGLTVEEAAALMRISVQRLYAIQSRAFDRLRRDAILQSYAPERLRLSPDPLKRTGVSAFRQGRESRTEQVALSLIQAAEREQKRRQDNLRKLLAQMVEDGDLTQGEADAMMEG